MGTMVYSSNSTSSSPRSQYFDEDYSASGSSLDSCYSDMTTPLKRGATGATKTTLDKLLPHLREDTHGRLFSGITIEQFVEHAWGVSPKDILQIRSREWILKPESLEQYRSASSEPEMYEPFSEIAVALTKSVRDALGKGESPVVLWNKGGNYVMKDSTSAARKPDMLSVLFKTLLDLGSKPEWWMVYNFMEFKKKLSARLFGNAFDDPSTSSLGSIPEHESTATDGGRPSRVAPSGSPISRGKAVKRGVKSASTSKGKKIIQTSIASDGESSRNLSMRAMPVGTAGGRVHAQPVTSSNKRKFDGSHSDTASKRVRSSDSTASRITNDQMQLATYALEAMAVSTRHYATGIFIDKFIVSLWYYDRSCVIRTVNFDFRNETEMFALVLYGMSQCNKITAGFDRFLSFPHPDPAAPAASVKRSARDRMVGSRFVFPSEGQTDTSKPSTVIFHVKDTLSQYRGLIGRGTMVYSVSQIHEDKPDEDDRVLKISWPLTIRTRESKTIETLLRAIPEWKDHLPEVHFSSTYTAERLDLPRFELLKFHPEKDKLEDRELHVLGMSLYKKLWEVDSVVEFQAIFLDCVECHYHAYTTGKVLHRDLSENNLMFKRDNSAKGVVNDWDMASHLDDKGEVPTSTARHRTGTIPFMACDLLVEKPPVHIYRHDLESFFYILIWAAVHFDIENKRRLPTHAALKLWDNDSLTIVYNAKTSIFYRYEDAKKTVFCHVREEFSDVLQSWIIPLWDLFYKAIRSSPGPFSYETDYDYITLGGNITFHKFMAAIGQEPRRLEGEGHFTGV